MSKYIYIEKKNTDTETENNFNNENYRNKFIGSLIRYRDNSAINFRSDNNQVPIKTRNFYNNREYVYPDIDSTEISNGYPNFPLININEKYNSFKVSDSNIELEGLLRFNFIEYRFEIFKNNRYIPIIKTDDTRGNTGKSYFKRLLFSDNKFNNKKIINKGENKRFIGNIFKDILVKNENTPTNNQVINYSSNLIYQAPGFIYNANNIFDLFEHNIIFKQNDTSSYKVLVRKNDSWIKNDNWNNHLDISNVIRNENNYEYNFDTYFKFYNHNFKKMFLNKFGFISFLSKFEFDNSKGVESFDFNKFSRETILLTIQSYTNISCLGGHGNDLTLDFTVGSDGYIDTSTIVINNPGYGYKNGDIIRISNTNATLIVNNIKNKTDEINYKRCLLGYNINFLRGDIKFTYLSKVYVGLGRYNEIVITYLNLSYKRRRQLLNCQVRLWTNSSKTKTNYFKDREKYFSDDYFTEGDIQISYFVFQNETKKKYNNLSSELINFENLFIGLSGNVDHNSETYKPLNFSSLLDRRLKLKDSSGFPRLESKLIFESDYNLGSMYTNLDTNKYHLKIKDSIDNSEVWTTSYLENDNNFKYYIKIINLGEIEDVTKLPSNLFLAISSINDSKYIYEVREITDDAVEDLISGSSGIQNDSEDEEEEGETADTNQEFFYSDSTIKDNNFILQDIKISEMDSLLNTISNRDFISISELNNRQGKNVYKDYINIYNSETQILYDSDIYRIQIKMTDIPTIEVGNDPDETILSRKFSKLSLTDSKKNLYLKIIFRLDADRIPFNTSFSKAIIFNSIGVYGHYNINKDYSNYYRLKLNKRKYNIELVHFLNNTIPSIGLSLEIYDINENIKAFSGTTKGVYPAIEFDNTSGNNGDLYYLKVSGENNFYYFGFKMNISE